jgi:hypothetical protein
MQKSEKHSNIRIKNPLSKNHFVKLLNGQKISLIFNKPELQDCSISISTDLLEIEEIFPVHKGWSAVISQKLDFSSFESSVFLGDIVISNKNEVVSSLAVATHSSNDFYKIANPTNNKFRLEPHHVLDVVFYSFQYGEHYNCSLAAGQLRLEKIDHSVRILNFDETFILADKSVRPIEEHSFKFRLDEQSIKIIQTLPKGKYDSGKISFYKFTDVHQVSNVSVTCNWRKKKLLIPKPLLFPKNPIKYFMKPPKHAMKANVTLKKINSEELEVGCNVFFAKNH